MRPAYDEDRDHGDRLSRLEDADRQTVSQLAANTVMLSAMADKVTAGFDRIGERLAQIGAPLQAHTSALQSLQEARGRWQSAGKWAAGIVSAVVVAALVMGLGLRR